MCIRDRYMGIQTASNTRISSVMQPEKVFLEGAFRKFAGGREEMDGREFAKTIKDCNLLDKKLTTTDVDLIFAKYKTKSARKINFYQFEAALREIATRKGIRSQDVEEIINLASGPNYSGTKSEYIKFHDDKNSYTGVYARGGPSTVSSGKISDLSQLTDRAPADRRGVKQA
eukprot:TRINITY_DN10067_c0_g1_i1.p1 TRINITY_DN10067_c0_g1~~TRINITY_DN10067_c0_g1_i1.p1  ORF type:complete len:196 (+),score=55.22 TRINITY_DN10067_c0_g1_i1:75-590(+)